ncbi:TPA: hypothetical protein DEG21_01435 [Patescibacteria group bacterium]|nr:hypothetical protein [Candidatus Gracilibacteria bacterium]HBY74554.1 hypothetical protein [Candidatus Gracilibacteria bacterium]
MYFGFTHNSSSNCLDTSSIEILVNFFHNSTFSLSHKDNFLNSFLAHSSLLFNSSFTCKSLFKLSSFGLNLIQPNQTYNDIIKLIPSLFRIVSFSKL